VSATEEKTEKPTPKKVKESRKEGQVARTQELGAWTALLLSTIVFPAAVRYEIGALDDLMTGALRTLDDPTTARALELLGRGFLHSFVVLIVLSSCMLVISAAVTLAQGGFYLATKAVQPKASKLDPIKGLKRIFGPQAAWEGVKMLVKCAMVALLVWSAMRAMMPLLGGMVPMGVVLSLAGERAMSLLRTVAVAGVVMAALDYLVIRRRTGKQTRMSKNEIKQEHKQQEGDPLLKGAIRSRQITVSRNRMLADITHADVVLVNPTHVAVALRYDAERGAPTVVARGAGVIAARIREVAAEHEVPLVRDVPLARALYSSTEVGQEIPAELFGAVAHVLAFVISRRTRGARGGTHRSPRVEAELPEVPAIGRRRRRVPQVALVGADQRA
jgi:flagellar biosynthesis protein FlhB